MASHQRRTASSITFVTDKAPYNRSRSRPRDVNASVPNGIKNDGVVTSVKASTTRNGATARFGAIESGEKLTEWLAWANAHADRLDPLKESRPSVLSDVSPCIWGKSE